MGKTLGFAEFDREAPKRVSATLRTQNWREIFERWPESDSRTQGARCMDCAVPFCHGGCPLGNLIPDWNHHVYTGNWEQALRALDQTNNFPEFTGRICPAPCEASCVLAINDDPVTIEYIEKAIADHGFEQDWITPRPPERRTGKKIAVVGSGPAGLAAAAQLNEAGHSVTVFERDEVIGGILSLGIPEFKLEKSVVQRRVKLMAAGGVEAEAQANAGRREARDRARPARGVAGVRGRADHREAGSLDL
ncbi:MAG: NAD(P)-binding protein, partial [Dehalococcoidia bacterium]|nr:NAD(P)-binding protein [Dehalococcoidia bacterium]